MNNSDIKSILFLGPDDSPLIQWLESQGEKVVQTSKKLAENSFRYQDFDFLISYGYRHILSKTILDNFPDTAINLHISYLPWNRGADPNFWSFMDHTPKGVTIHHLDEGIDTGDIIVQQEILFDSAQETLATSYTKLQEAIQILFRENWRNIKSGKCLRSPQSGQGSEHKLFDMDAYKDQLSNGWDTPITTVENINKGK